MAAERKCCVRGCEKTREQSHVVLHKFPNPEKDPIRFRTWTFSIGGDIMSLDDDYVYKYRRVCDEHFEQKYKTWGKILTNTAVPTLHLKGFVIKRTPLVDTTNTAGSAQNLNVASTSGLMAPPSVSVENQDPQKDYVIGGQGSSSKRDLKKTAKNVMSQKIASLQKEVKKLTAIKDKYATRLKKAHKLTENKTFLSTLKKFSAMAAIFTLLQFREHGKKKMGRRFTQDEKVMALSIYKRGPRAYRLLSKIFVLPSPYTLGKMVSRAAIRPGINENIFDQLKKRASKMKEDDKFCTLVFDEMAITPHFDYNRKKDKIIGFVDNGEVVKNEIADHALVFMIRGIVKNYKQPIGYTFCSGSTKKHELASLIKKMISKLHLAGFKVLATVCDQGASNVSAINYLIEETRIKHLRRGEELRKSVFEVDEEEVIPLYDVPHLLKGMRNNLLSKNLKYSIDGNNKTAKWEHVMKLYECNPTYKGLRLIKNLTEGHCNPQKIPKMKVKFAAQIFSHTVGLNMGFLAEHGLLPEECKDTADLLLFFDELFDSLNGSFNGASKKGGKVLLQAVTPSSKHQETWNKSKAVLKSMKFVSTEGNVSVVPSITNWLRTIENIELLKKKLFNKYNIKSLWCRHLNQDPIENFFGSIRSHGYRNNFPTCAGFEAAFVSLLVNNLTSAYSSNSNCEDDSCFMFKSLKGIFFKKYSINQMPTEVDFDYLYNENIIQDFEIKKMDPRIMSSLEYVTGYILRQCSKKVFKNCKTCKSNLYQQDENSYITIREYNKNKAYLTYPSPDLIYCFSTIQDIVTAILKENAAVNNIRNYIQLILHARLSYNFVHCKTHKKEVIEKNIATSCMFFICNWCRDTNKIISGAVNKYDSEDIVQNLAFNYANKRKRK